jgi:hypothetical protein
MMDMSTKKDSVELICCPGFFSLFSRVSSAALVKSLILTVYSLAFFELFLRFVSGRRQLTQNLEKSASVVRSIRHLRQILRGKGIQCAEKIINLLFSGILTFECVSEYPTQKCIRIDILPCHDFTQQRDNIVHRREALRGAAWETNANAGSVKGPHWRWQRIIETCNCILKPWRRV